MSAVLPKTSKKGEERNQKQGHTIYMICVLQQLLLSSLHKDQPFKANGRNDRVLRSSVVYSKQLSSAVIYKATVSQGQFVHL